MAESGKTPPRTHNLVYLAEKSGMALSGQQTELLETVNDFNLEARYPDEKFSFYKRCTRTFTRHYLNQIEGGGWKGWRVGGLEGWRVGGLEGWKGGRVGGVEGWEGWRIRWIEGWMCFIRIGI